MAERATCRVPFTSRRLWLARIGRHAARTTESPKAVAPSGAARRPATAVRRCCRVDTDRQLRRNRRMVVGTTGHRGACGSVRNRTTTERPILPDMTVKLLRHGWADTEWSIELGQRDSVRRSVRRSDRQRRLRPAPQSSALEMVERCRLGRKHNAHHADSLPSGSDMTIHEPPVGPTSMSVAPSDSSRATSSSRVVPSTGHTSK